MPSVVLKPTSSKKSSSPDFHHVNWIVMYGLLVLYHFQANLSLLRFYAALLMKSRHLYLNTVQPIILLKNFRAGVAL